MPRHSLIIAYRNRPESLARILKCLDAQDGNRQWEVIVSDWGDGEAQALIDAYRPGTILLTHNRVDTFNKSAALNTAIKVSTGAFFSFVDVDVVLQPGHLTEIEEFYANPDNSHRKLSTRVMYLDELTTKSAQKTNHPYEFIQANCFPNPAKWNYHAEVYGNERRILGNSHHTISRNQLDAIGIASDDISAKRSHYDERFVGYGLEDLELNNRYWNHYGDATMQKLPAWHLWHPKESDWAAGNLVERNQNLYRIIQAEARSKYNPEMK